MAATKKAKTVKKRRRTSRFHTMLIMLAVLAVLVIATLLMRSAYKAAVAGREGTADSQSSSIFSVKEIAVSGSTRYLPEAIIRQSGMYVGQSVWSVNKSDAAARVLAAFPYIEEVAVENTAYNKYRISVTETKEIGVMYGAAQWLAVGANGKILDARPVDSDRPLRGLYFKGADPAGEKPGDQAMEERCWRIVSELLAAFEKYGLTGVGEIDLTNKSDLRLTVNSRILIRLGNDSNLTHQIGVVMGALPGIESQYGAGAAGQLDVSAFSEAGGNERAVFTPRELLPAATATAPAAAE